MHLLKQLTLLEGHKFTATTALILIYLIENGPKNSFEIGEYLQKCSRYVTWNLYNLKSSGWIERIGTELTHGVTITEGELVKTNRNNGVYQVSDKLLSAIGEPTCHR